MLFRHTEKIIGFTIAGNLFSTATMPAFVTVFVALRNFFLAILFIFSTETFLQYESLQYELEWFCCHEFLLLELIQIVQTFFPEIVIHIFNVCGADGWSHQQYQHAILEGREFCQILVACLLVVLLSLITSNYWMELSLQVFLYPLPGHFKDLFFFIFDKIRREVKGEIIFFCHILNREL